VLPGETVHTGPLQLVYYSRGSQGAGALPTNGQVITTPIIATAAMQPQGYNNHADGTLVAEDDFGGAANSVQRYPGLYYADVFIFQDIAATLELQERNFLRLLSPGGAAPEFKTVLTRVVAVSAVYRERFVLMNAEARFRYTNGAGNTTVHDWSIILRSE
jgi:hypothetical protein